MGNPLFDMFGGSNGSFVVDPKLIRAFSILRNAQNPQLAIQQLAQQNLQVAQAMQMCQGQDPKSVFYSMCQQRGIDPNVILNQFKQ